MSVWMNDNKVLIILSLQLFAAFFAAGMFWQRMKSLEKNLLDGITALKEKIDKMDGDIDELRIARAAIEARCAGRKEWIGGIEQEVKAIVRQG